MIYGNNHPQREKACYAREIETFKASTKKITPTPAEWLKLRGACLAKFGEEDGPKKFKEWQKGKWIQFRPCGT